MADGNGSNGDGSNGDGSNGDGSNGKRSDGNGSSRSTLSGLLLVLGSIGGLALLGWVTLVMLDLKHLNTGGFTLP